MAITYRHFVGAAGDAWAPLKKYYLYCRAGVLPVPQDLGWSALSSEDYRLFCRGPQGPPRSRTWEPSMSPAPKTPTLTPHLSLSCSARCSRDVRDARRRHESRGLASGPLRLWDATVLLIYFVLCIPHGTTRKGG